MNFKEQTRKDQTYRKYSRVLIPFLFSGIFTYCGPGFYFEPDSSDGTVPSFSYSSSTKNFIYLDPTDSMTPTLTGATAVSYSISPSTLPAGLSFDTSTGVISGSPTTLTASSQAYNVQVITTSGANLTTSIHIGIQLSSSVSGTYTSTTSTDKINTYSGITTTSLTAGVTQSFDVEDGSSFSSGQEVLIIQMQGSSDALKREFAIIQSVSGNTITLTRSLQNSYTSGSFSQANSSVTQIISVPNYSDVNIPPSTGITASPWSGHSGGIVVFRANGTVTVSSGGKISTSLLGFRVGSGTSCTSSTCYGMQGESYLGLGSTAQTGNGGGGGGGGIASQSNGGGGGYGTTGSTAGLGGSSNSASAAPGSGGSSYGSVDLSSLLLGSGGGGGTCETGCSAAPWDPTHYGKGGGIVYILANSISVNTGGSIISQGGDADQRDYSTGGAGSGGSIYLLANSLNIGTSLVTALGGAPGGISPGGAGGKGRIRLDYNTLSGTTSPPAYTTTPLP